MHSFYLTNYVFNEHVLHAARNCTANNASASFIFFHCYFVVSAGAAFGISVQSVSLNARPYVASAMCRRLCLCCSLHCAVLRAEESQIKSYSLIHSYIIHKFTEIKGDLKRTA